MKLEWLVFALTDRDGIFDDIETDSPRAAIEVDIAIADAAKRLVDFPASGRPGGSREPESWS